MKISNRIKEYREKYNISLRDFGAMCNMSGQAISNIEKGISYPSGDNEEVILEVLNSIPKAKLIKTSRTNDLTGQRFGRLTVIGPSISRLTGKHMLWVCECECGNLSKVKTYNLISGETKSCGCYRRERISKLNDRR